MNFPSIPGGGNKREAFKSMISTTLKILAILSVMALYVIVFLKPMLEGVSGETSSLVMDNMFGMIAKTVLLVIPVVVLSGFIGYCAHGTESRLAFRLFQSAYIVCALVLFSRIFEYSMNELTLIIENIAITNISLTLDISLIIFLIALIPLLSAVDAILEYKENKVPVEVFEDVPLPERE